jgi:hypothetical protein
MVADHRARAYVRQGAGETLNSFSAISASAMPATAASLTPSQASGRRIIGVRDGGIELRAHRRSTCGQVRPVAAAAEQRRQVDHGKQHDQRPEGKDDRGETVSHAPEGTRRVTSSA